MNTHATCKNPTLLCASLKSGAYQADCSACRAAMHHFSTAYTGHHAYAALAQQMKTELAARIHDKGSKADMANLAWTREERQVLADRPALPWLQPSNYGLPITDEKQFSSTAPMWKK